MKVSQFVQIFHKKVFELSDEDVHRSIVKQGRAIRQTLQMVLGGKDQVKKEEAAKLQEKFHVRLDQLASDHRTWKKGGFKRYAKPKQFVSGPVAGASKKAFDWILNDFLRSLEEAKKEPSEEKMAASLDFPKIDDL